MSYQIIPVTAYQQNCSLIWCQATHKAALIDPGGDVDVLLRHIEARKVNMEKILLTHGHLDHVGAAKHLAQHFSIPIIGPHQDDAFWLQMLPRQAEMFGFEPLDPFVPDQWLSAGMTVNVGELRLQVLHCPGHTPGHVVFYNAGQRLAFVGDVLFKGSIGRTDFPRGDYATLINSIENNLLPLGDDVTFVPGHGPLSTLGEERLTNPFLQN
ncbi:hypothetical protein Tel_15805 [Candidatus Tenderia electrophaga]|jgi:glyoxylase-like metal-dependent hydrolase (beta-lactamase superfamily II)|uniref:Metallo-beta-lactamase domain-containing protein n=1 Tax=Candidatus Tenderia electrophaga TaxID=1748243 RepID=A0A0S2TH67_9GAMM|nr:hypothetical protein Tel_15805 [Candidatus Tenderia electrophaga]